MALFKNSFLARLWWFMPIILAIQEAESGGFKKI
jgi:hypothetical protein